MTERAEAHKPTNETREIVTRAAMTGMTKRQAAFLLPLKSNGKAHDTQTINTHYEQEWERGEALAVNKLAQVVYQRATGDDGDGPADIKAAMWLLERKGGDAFKPPKKGVEVELGKPGEFARLTDEELNQEIKALESRVSVNRDALAVVVSEVAQDGIGEEDG